MLLRFQIFGLVMFYCRAEATELSNITITQAPVTVNSPLQSSWAPSSVLPNKYGGMTEEETRKVVDEMAHDVAVMINQDVAIARHTYNEKGKALSEAEAAEFFLTVGSATLQRIEPTVVQLNSLVKNKERVAEVIANEVTARGQDANGEKAKMTRDFIMTVLEQA